MIEIKIQAKDKEELLKNIRELSEAFISGSKSDIISGQMAIGEIEHPAKSKEKEQKKKDKKESEAATPKPKITKEQIRAKFRELNTPENRDGLKQILTDAGVKSISSLSEGSYESVMSALEKFEV